MRLIVWGTGNLYQKHRGFLSQFHIIKLCDSDPGKQGTYIDGIEVIEPDQIKELDYDHIVVMVYHTESICDALLDLKIPQEKILLHSQMYLLKRPQLYVNHLGREIPFSEWILEKEKCILLISHNYSYTGIPVALKNMANVLRRMGYSVLMAAMEGGPFTIELEQQEIDYMTDLVIGYQTRSFHEMLERCEAIVIGTFSLYYLSEILGNVQTPVLWWVHETDERYYIGKETLSLKENITYWAGGDRVKRVFSEHYEDVLIRKLQYCIPDSHRERTVSSRSQKRDDYLTTAVIGTIDRRKAQDILMKAVIRMPLRYRCLLKVIMIGRLDEADASFAEEIRGLQKQICDLEWIQEMSQAHLDAFYEDIDVLVCPSRDDPMPIVVTQAMMHRKICVVSEEVGQAEFIRSQENGFVFPCGDVDELQRILMWLIDNRDKSTGIGMASRKIFDQEFSESVMEQRLRAILGAGNAVKDI